MADDDHGFGAVADEVFQPADRLDVEVVGGLVEEEHVGRLQQQFRQFDAHAPASREFACRSVEVLALEAQAEECLFHVFLEVGHVNGVKLLREGRYLLDELHVVVALVVGARAELVVNAVYLCLDLVEVGKGLARLLKHGASVFRHQVLRQVGNDAILRSGDGSTRGRADACYDLEQRTLTCAIFAHEGDAVLLIDLEGNVFEQGGAAKLDGQSIYCDHVGFLIFLLLLVFSSHYLSQYKPGVHGHGGEEAVVAAHDFKPFAE